MFIALDKHDQKDGQRPLNHLVLITLQRRTKKLFTPNGFLPAYSVLKNIFSSPT
jgi:hypothetical protein